LIEGGNKLDQTTQYLPRKQQYLIGTNPQNSSTLCFNFIQKREGSAVEVGLERSYDPVSYAGGSLLLVGSPKPDRSKVMTQTKRDALALHVGGGNG